MGQAGIETKRDWTTRRRRRSALLSVIAAGVTALILVPAGVNSGPANVRYFWLELAIPALAVSGAAAFQYRWRFHTGAGAAAAVLYWALVYIGLLRWGTAFFIGAVLQTCAWYISRPGQRPPSTQP